MSTVIDTSSVASIIDKVSDLLNQHYIFLDVATKISDYLHNNLTSGAYSRVGDINELCRVLTDDIRSINGDKHLRLFWDPQIVSQPNLNGEPADFWLRDAAYENFGFHRLERLKGNIGYLDLRMFAPPAVAGETAVAAMNFLAGMDALIFDLRDNGGGDPAMIQLISSYLFKGEPKHLNSFYYRTDEKTTQFWTLPYVPGKRMPDADVYVLTSDYTFSAAEEFTYNLQNLKRATIIGETTGGGANPGEELSVDEGFVLFVPSGRAVNPISGTNWEGTGVAPDIAVAREDALHRAHGEALRRLIDKCSDPRKKHYLEWDLATVEAEHHPAGVDISTLQRCVGIYGKEVFELVDGTLRHYHAGFHRPATLIPMVDGTFALGAEMRVQFELPTEGRATAVRLYHRGGNQIDILRTE